MSASDKYTLKPILTEKFAGIIWKIETDEARKQIAVESRDAGSRLVTFSVFDYQTGQVLLKELRTESDWWWSLDRLHDNMLFLHGYLTDNSPEHKGISAIDVHTGTVKWQNFQLALENISAEGLIVYNPMLQPRKLQLASPQTGEIKNSIDIFEPLPRDLVFPDIISDKALLPNFLPENTAGPVSYLKYQDKEIWSFHTVNQQHYSQHLLISQNNTIILQDILAAGIQKLNPEAFFLQKNCLFYIRGNYQEIVSYLL